MTREKRKKFLNTAIKAARLAGEVIINNLGKISKKDIGIKKPSDFVTAVDKESERLIIETIKRNFPDHIFLTEESLKEHGKEAYRWIIDPLDGTTNYIHGFPIFSVSLALEYKGSIIIGVTLDPLRDELFYAEKGSGSFLNGRRVNVSKEKFKESLITTGFPFRKKELIDIYLKLFRNIFFKVSDLRRAGSAALDLAYLACGRCEGFFEIGLSPWDIAAGSLLIKEAGGLITDFCGGNEYLKTGNIVAGNKIVHKELLNEIRMVFEGIIDR